MNVEHIHWFEQKKTHTKGKKHHYHSMFRIPHGNQTPITARSPTIAAILKVVRANFPGIRKLSQCKLMFHFYCTIHNHITIAASINVLAYDKIVRFMSFSTTPSPPTPTDIAQQPAVQNLLLFHLLPNFRKSMFDVAISTDTMDGI